MRSSFVILLLLFSNAAEVVPTDISEIHLPLYRRGGKFSQHEPVNLTYLSRILAHTEARFARTYTDVEGNRIVRRWHDGPHGVDDYLLDGAGLGGSWYTTLQIGTPPQTLEVDIDMLSPDFYTIMTTSGKGSKYDTFASSSHEPTHDQTHPTCVKTTDILHLPILKSTISLDNSPFNNQKLTKTPFRIPFPICQPPKYTHQTLYHSGSILGLSPTIPTNKNNNENDNHDEKNDEDYSPLSRLSSPSLLTHLLQTTTITHPLIHITLLTPTTGLLTLGNPPTHAFEKTKVTLKKQLSRLSSPYSTSSSSNDATDMDQEIASTMAFLIPEGSTPDSQFTWTDAGAGGVRGWHGGMVNVWVNGVKVLRNQAVVFDVNCPVILAPMGVGSVVFEAVGGRSVGSLVGDDSGDGDGAEKEEEKRYWAYPCLNPPVVELEIGGWRFPVTDRDGFGLGRVDVDVSGVSDGDDGDNDGDGDSGIIGTGYCVSVIVETDMGSRPRWSGSAMADVWVLGEPFFRAVGVVFDFGGGEGKGSRVGVRKY